MVIYNPTDSRFLTLAQTRTNNGTKDVKLILDRLDKVFYTLDDDGNFDAVDNETAATIAELSVGTLKGDDGSPIVLEDSFEKGNATFDLDAGTQINMEYTGEAGSGSLVIDSLRTTITNQFYDNTTTIAANAGSAITLFFNNDDTGNYSQTTMAEDSINSEVTYEGNVFNQYLGSASIGTTYNDGSIVVRQISDFEGIKLEREIPENTTQKLVIDEYGVNIITSVYEDADYTITIAGDGGIFGGDSSTKGTIYPSTSGVFIEAASADNDTLYSIDVTPNYITYAGGTAAVQAVTYKANRVQTTNATPANLIEIPLNTARSSINITATINAVNGNPWDKGYGAQLFGMFVLNTSGTITQISTTDKVEKTNFTGGTTADFVISGGTIYVQVTGETATNITWNGYCNYQGPAAL